MRCVQIDPTGAVVDVEPQPADLTGCAFVLVSGDLSAPFQIPSSELMADSFEFALSLVLTFGVVGFFIGRLVNFWR